MDRRNNYLEKLEKIDNDLIKLNGEFLDSSTPDDQENTIFPTFNEAQIKIATNFTKEEFLLLLSYFELEIAKMQNMRGPKSKITDLDKFLLLLTYLKSYGSYASLSNSFSLTPSYAQKLLETMIQKLSIKFTENFICFITREKQIKEKIGFEDFKDCVLVLDCSIQEVPQYNGGFDEVKTFYSKKHGKYCVKKKYAHLPDGRVCFVSKFFPGARHDFSFFRTLR